MEYKINIEELPLWKGREVKPVEVRRGEKGELFYSSFHGEILEIVDQETYHPHLIVEVEHKEPELHYVLIMGTPCESRFHGSYFRLSDEPSWEILERLSADKHSIDGTSFDVMTIKGTEGQTWVGFGHYHDGPKKD